MHEQLLVQAFMIIISSGERRRESFQDIRKQKHDKLDSFAYMSMIVKTNVYTIFNVYTCDYVVIADGERIPLEEMQLVSNKMYLNK